MIVFVKTKTGLIPARYMYAGIKGDWSYLKIDGRLRAILNRDIIHEQKII